WSALLFAVSRSFCAIRFRASNVLLRSYWRRFKARSARLFSTFARFVASVASACDTFDVNEAGSIFATRWPFFTGELKSTSIARIGPETYVPTCTVLTGFTVPVAVIVCSIVPRSTGAVRYSTGPPPSAPVHQRQRSASSTTPPAIQSQRRFARRMGRGDGGAGAGGLVGSIGRGEGVLMT